MPFPAPSDIRRVWRTLIRRRGFVVSVVGILGAGIAAATLMTAVVSGVLVRPLPYDHAGSVAMIWDYVPQLHLGYPEQPISGRVLSFLRDNTQAFSVISGFRARNFDLGSRATPIRLNGIEATGGFFQAIGVRPAVGRFFTRAEEQPGADRVAVLSWNSWQRVFGGSPTIVGRRLQLDDVPYVVIGVAPRGFGFPRGAEMPPDFQFATEAQLWVPLRPPQRGPSDLALVGRTRSGVTTAAAQQDLDRVTQMLDKLYPTGKGYLGMRAVPLRQQLVGAVRPMLLTLFAAVGLLLLISCFNAAQLLVARTQERRRDLAIHASLGASPALIARDLFLEALLLSGGAGVLGTAIGLGGTAWLRAHPPAQLPQLANLSFDWRVVAAAVLLTVVVGCVFGIAPAFAGRRVELSDVMRRGGRGWAGSRVGTRTRRWLIAGEVALSVVLIAGAGLLARSLSRQLHSALGFHVPESTTFEVSLPPVAYPETQGPAYMLHPRSVQFLAQALDNLRAIPGVQAVGLGKPLPLSGAQEATVFWREGAPPLAAGQTNPVAEYTVASPDMFTALGTPIVSGRAFTDDDRNGTLPVVIVNEAMAQWLWPGQSPLGKRIKLGRELTPAPWMTVVGVSGDLKRYSLTESPRPEMFVPYTQQPYPTFRPMGFIVRSRRPTAALLPQIRKAIAAVDPGIPVANVRTVRELVDAASANARLSARTTTAFGAAALVLAMIGLYGVIGFLVYQRRQEFGVRRALGATGGQIVRLVLRDGIAFVGIGLGAGLALAVAGGWAIRSQLYDVSAFNVASLATSLGVLVAASLAACLVPARRAAGVDPRVALEDN